MTIGDDENIKKLSDKLRELAQRKTAKERSNLKPTKHQPTIAEMIAEGEKLLAEDLQVKKAIGTSPEKPPKANIPPTSSNPYLQARHKVLQAYPQWRRNEVAEMEKTGNLDNKFYAAFIKDVSIEGDRLSNLSS
jgi:hypothetical protein